MTPLIIEPAILQTRYLTGILRPVFRDGVWIVTAIEERDGCDGPEILIAERFALSAANLRRAAWCALCAVKAEMAVNR